jgi:Gpi18-like mannosyltransferase
MGIIPALADDFAIYAPPYLYLLSLATLLRPILSPELAIKLIPIFFDFCNAFLVYRIVKVKYDEGSLPLLAAALFLSLPTVMVNSAFWGQIDSIFTCFILLTFYLVLKERMVWAMFIFGIAFAIKAQAAFLAPFLLVLVLKRHLHWKHFGMIPLGYLFAMLPAWLAGRPLVELLTIYLKQANTFDLPSKNAPNPYIVYLFLPPETYPAIIQYGLIAASVLLLIWALVHGLKKFPLTTEKLVYLALVSAALTPFLLPKMHDRYFYLADVFSFLLVFFIPSTWIAALSYQVISLLAYSLFLLRLNVAANLIYATLLNIVVISFLLVKQWRLEAEK